MTFPAVEIWFVLSEQGEVLLRYLTEGEARSAAEGFRRLRGPMPADRVHIIRRQFVDAHQTPLRR